jgi:beta-barrel assembly-enhancing protease
MPYEPSYDPRATGGRPSMPASGGIGGGLLSLLFRNPKIMAMLAMLAFGYFTYTTSTEKRYNEFTGESVRVKLKPEQEVAMGLQSVPEMVQQFGGAYDEPILQNKINKIGARLLAAKEEILRRRNQDDFEYPFAFHVLNDKKTINAFALPGGQVFITYALLAQLPNEDAVAGVLGHEIGHVLAWHSNKQMAKSSLLQSIATAAAMATGDGARNGQAIGQMVGQLLQTKYGREDESQSDRIGVQLMLVAGYDPTQLVAVMEVLKESMKGNRAPEILSSHPFPETRAKQIGVYIDHFRKDPFGTWEGGFKN